MRSESEVTESCPMLRNPVDHSLPGSSVHGIFQARALEWGAIAFPVHRHRSDQLPFLGKTEGRWRRRQMCHEECGHLEKAWGEGGNSDLTSPGTDSYVLSKEPLTPSMNLC